MSFQNYEQFGGVPAQDGGAVPGGPNQQDATMAGQLPEQGQPPFQGAPTGDGAPPVTPGSDGKTTLW